MLRMSASTGRGNISRHGWAVNCWMLDAVGVVSEPWGQASDTSKIGMASPLQTCLSRAHPHLLRSQLPSLVLAQPGTLRGIKSCTFSCAISPGKGLQNELFSTQRAGTRQHFAQRFAGFILLHPPMGSKYHLTRTSYRPSLQVRVPPTPALQQF